MIPINKINITTSAPLLKYYYWVKSCYTRPFATVQNPFLKSKSSDYFFFKKNGVEVHIAFHFQVHTTII